MVYEFEGHQENDITTPSPLQCSINSHGLGGWKDAGRDGGNDVIARICTCKTSAEPVIRQLESLLSIKRTAELASRESIQATDKEPLPIDNEHGKMKLHISTHHTALHSTRQRFDLA